MKIFVTYGCGSDLGMCYSVVEADTAQDARKIIEAVCRRDFAFTYSEEDFAGQAEKYGLTEVPLQPQIMLD